VRNLFEVARESKPSIVFIDEIDALCSARSDNESESARRIKTEFLVQMDGVGNDQQGILLLGATNLPWGLDQAVRRRFEKRVYIPLPDRLARSRMVQRFLEKHGQENHSIDMQGVQYLSERTEGFSGSDISILNRQALLQPIQMLKTTTHFRPVEVQGEDGQTVEKFEACGPRAHGAQLMDLMDVPDDKLKEPSLSLEDFSAALIAVKPSVSGGDLKPFEEWTQQFGEDGSNSGVEWNASMKERTPSNADMESPEEIQNVPLSKQKPNSTLAVIAASLASLSKTLDSMSSLADIEKRLARLEQKIG
jgi:vacuolar protein-sorting-associated protein 4